VNELVLSSHPEAARVGRMLAGMAETMAEPMSADRLEGYVAALSDVPLEHLRLGMVRALKASTFFPKPAEIRAHVDAAVRTQTAAQQIEPRVTTDEYDPRTLVNHLACEDAGWVLQDPELYGGRTYVRKCDCWSWNPKLRSVPTYSEREDRYR
jgi:hypothetical protein